MDEFSRIDPEDEHAARFLAGHGITSADLYRSAQAYPDLAPWCLKMAPLVDAAHMPVTWWPPAGAATTMHLVPPASGD